MEFVKKYRPQDLLDFVGQKHILNENSVLYNLIKQKKLEHCFFTVLPGQGKQLSPNL